MTDRVVYNPSQNNDQEASGFTHRVISKPGATASDPRTYFFSVPFGGTDNVHAHRSSDASGTGWAQDDASATPAFDNNNVAVWYDKWTAGDGGTDVHVVYTHAGSGAGLYYCRYDLASDTPSGTVALLTGVSPAAGDPLCITKLPNGELYVLYIDPGGDDVYFFRSQDGGSSWDTLVNSAPTIGDIPVNQAVRCCMVPANSSFADVGPYIFVYDEAGEQIVLVTWTGAELFESLTIDDDASAVLGIWSQISAINRPGDGTVFVAWYARGPDDSSNELRLFKIPAGFFDYESMPPILAAPIGSEAAGVQLSVDQTTGHLFVAYVRGDWQNSTDVFYRRSRDGGYTWGPEIQVNDDPSDDYRDVHLPHGFASDGAFGTLHVIAWDDDAGHWFSSDTNWQIGGAYTVRESADGGADQQDDVMCQTGQPPSVPDQKIFLGLRYPDYFVPDDVEASYWIGYDGGAGVIQAGTTVRGSSSGATGIVYGTRDNPDQVKIGMVSLGPRGEPFLPNETLEDIANPGNSIVVRSRPTGGATGVSEIPDSST